MLNDSIHSLLRSHRSIRKYKTDKIPSDCLKRILESGIRASSSGNMQTYSIIITEDPEQKQKLLAPHFNQKMVIEAPLLLTFCADFRRMRKWLELREAPPNFDNFMSFMIATIDAILVAQNTAIAAEAEGLGLCFLGTTLASCDEIGKILNCPENVVPVVGFTLGYPNEVVPARDRLPLTGLVHREQYRDQTNEAIQQIYADRERTGLLRYMQDENLRKLAEEANAENLAQIYTKVKYTRESHLNFSKTVLDYLNKQNFLQDS